MFPSIWYFCTKFRNSCPGAYIFAPAKVTPIAVCNKQVQLVVTQGPLYQEVKQIFSDWVVQRIRLYNNQNWVELESDIGNI